MVRLTSKNLTDLLRKNSEGLIYMSETDSPVQTIEPFPRTGELQAELCRRNGIEPDQPVIEQDFSELFNRLCSRHDWHSPEQAARAESFFKIRQILEDNLDDLTVMRFGRIRIHIFIFGTAVDGEIAGVKTFAVET